METQLQLQFTMDKERPGPRLFSTCNPLKHITSFERGDRINVTTHDFGLPPDSYLVLGYWHTEDEKGEPCLYMYLTGSTPPYLRTANEEGRKDEETLLFDLEPGITEICTSQLSHDMCGLRYEPYMDVRSDLRVSHRASDNDNVRQLVPNGNRNFNVA